MKRNELIALFNRYRSNQCTAEEAERLLRYIQSGKGRQVIEDLIAKGFGAEYDVLVSAEVKDSLERVYRRVQQHKRSTPNLVPVYRSSFRRWASIAAAVLIVLSAGVVLYRYSNNHQSQSVQLASQYGDDVLPGGNRAVLTLADGRKIDLDDAAKGLLAEQANISITKTDDGEVAYKIKAGPYSNAITGYNTVTTPKGGQYQIRLPDGSRVWLNAASSLRYPMAFAAGERRVQLTGEGYFEVARNEQQPFIVESHGQSIRVLGTEFNIQAYEKEPAVATTLVSGSISITPVATDRITVLKPGEQSILTGGSLKVRNVSVGNFTAWKEGLIVLNNVDLATVIRQLERWYDVEFTGAEPNFVSAPFFGEIPRDINLSGVLAALEIQTNIHFEIDGRRVLMSE